MESWQKEYYDAWRELRDKKLKPLASLLDTLKVSPNLVTVSGIILMLLFNVSLSFLGSYAIIFVFTAVVLDMLDGVLARYQKIASPRGKLYDISADALNFCIFIFTLAQYEFIAWPIAITLIFISIISRIIRIIYHKKCDKNTKIFYPVVGFLPNFLSLTSYVLGILDILLNNGIISSQIWTAFVLILGIDAVRYLFKISRIK